MNEKLENLYNQMDFEPNNYLKEYMRGSLILVEELKEKEIEEFEDADFWKLTEIQIFSNLINDKSINLINLREEE